MPESATAGRRADVPRVVNAEGAAQAGGMFPGGDGDGKGAGAGQPIDPLQPLLPVSPLPPGARDEAGGGGVEQYHAECNSVDAVTCVPARNAEHHGFELLATIDGSDTKFSCNLAHGLFSWMGVASMGIYLGDDFASFFSSVISGAAGLYIVTLTQHAGIGTDLQIRPGQDVRISGASGLAAAPNWGKAGIMGGWVVGTSKCGTYYSCWLAGWTGHPPYGPAYSNTRPPYSYSEAGRYPVAAEGVEISW